MSEITLIGIDLAKRVFQLHGAPRRAGSASLTIVGSIPSGRFTKTLRGHCLTIVSPLPANCATNEAFANENRARAATVCTVRIAASRLGQ